MGEFAVKHTVISTETQNQALQHRTHRKSCIAVPQHLGLAQEGTDLWVHPLPAPLRPPQLPLEKPSSQEASGTTRFAPKPAALPDLTSHCPDPHLTCRRGILQDRAPGREENQGKKPSLNNVLRTVLIHGAC